MAERANPGEQKSLLIVSPPPHLFSREKTPRIMLDVLIALFPAALAGFYFFGPRVAAVMALSVAAAVGSEWAAQRLLGRPVAVGDFSAAVTGLLVALNLPPTAPLWLPVVGSAFAVIIVKQLFGGLGGNFLNPALAARAFLMAAWPSQMTAWSAPGVPAAPYGLHAVTEATPLVALKNPELIGQLPSYFELLIGRIPGCIGETSALALLIGAGYLLWRRVIDWRIPAAFIGTVAVLTWALGRQGLFTGDPLAHVLAGGLVLGAFFMATDYVTAPVTPLGKLWFGFGCGLLTVLIRLYGGYPEGVSYSILIMNIAAPLVERYTVPRKFGEVKRAR